MRTLLMVIGLIILILGILFIGQGSGYFPYPKTSFMIGQPQWMYYGGGIAAVGLLLAALARR